MKRNIDRFPDDLMFQLSENEIIEVVSQNVIPHKKFFGGGTPLAFTETGVAMLSSMLKSKKAIQTNLAIIRTFVTIRKMSLNYKEILKKSEKMEAGYDTKFKEIFTALKYLIDPNPPHRKIGYNENKEV